MSTERVAESVFNLVFGRRASVAETARFASKKHNAHLCPDLQLSLDMVLSLVTRHFSLAYDTQGFKDSGVDVLLSLGETPDFVGFQIKSDSEATEKGLTSKLKSQYFDASQRYGERLRRYYIFLCFDAKTRVDRIREISSVFSDVGGVSVVEPAYAWNFLYKTSASVRAAAVTTELEQDDPVIGEARQLVVDLQPAPLFALALFLSAFADEAGSQLRVDDLRASSGFRSRLKGHPTWLPMEHSFPRQVTLAGATQGVHDDEIGRIASVIDYLDDFVDHQGDEAWSFDPLNNEPLAAITWDARARYGYHREVLAEYLFSTLDPGQEQHHETDAIARESAELMYYSSLRFDQHDAIFTQIILDNPDIFGTWTDSEARLEADRLLRAADIWGERFGE